MTERRAFSVAIFARRSAGDDAGKVLLIKHRRLGSWLPVGGEIEDGETPAEAATRELLEETGLVGAPVAIIDAIDGAPAGLLAYEEHAAGSKGLHMNFCFLVDVGADPVRPCDEWSDHRFVDLAGLRTLSCPTNVTQLARRALAGGRHPHVAVARAWLTAFNARDLDALLGLYRDDAVHISPKLRERRPETGGEVRGKPAMRDWWRDAFTRLPDLRYEERRVIAEGGSVTLEYTRLAPGEPDLVVAERYDVDDAGLIVKSHVFHG